MKSKNKSAKEEYKDFKILMRIADKRQYTYDEIIIKLINHFKQSKEGVEMFNRALKCMRAEKKKYKG